MKSKLTISEKIFRITQECKLVPRNGVGESNDSNRPLYSYVKIEDVLSVVNPLLEKYKLILTGSVPKEPITHVSKSFATTEVMVEWTLTNLDWPKPQPGEYENRVYRIPGSGTDDQGKGIYKSMTGSRKYACIFIFNLKCGDEPEAIERKETCRVDSNET